MKKKKIDLLYYSNLNELTGAATVLRNIINGFSEKEGFEVKAWSRDYTEQSVIDLVTSDDENVTHHQVNTVKQKIRSILDFFGKYSGAISLLIVLLTYFKNANRVVTSYNGDGEILFFHEIFTPYCFFKQKNRKWHQAKKIIVLHCDGNPIKMLFGYFPKMNNSWIAQRFFKKLLTKIFNDADSIVLLGENSKTLFCNLYPEYADKAVIIPNGLAEKEGISSKREDATRNDDVIKIVTVGSVGKRKGHDLLISALCLLTAAERRKFELHIVGDGGIIADLKEICEKNQIENAIFHGAQNEVVPFLKASNVFILASRDEGLPMAIIEAMRESLPIIATNVGDCSDLVSDVNGWLIQPQESQIAQTIRLVLNDENILQKGKMSYDLYKQKFTLNVMIDNYSKLFDK